MDDMQGVPGDQSEVDYAEMARPDSLKDLTDDEWNATPPTVRKAVMEREGRSKVNHTEQIARLTGEMNAMREMLGRNGQQNGNGNGKAAKKPGIEGMELDELERYHDHAEEIRASAEEIRWLKRSNPEAELTPDQQATMAKAAKLTPAVMRELLAAITARKSGVDKSEIEALRAELRGDKEASRLTGALTQKVVAEFGPAAVLPGNAIKMSAEKAYNELKAAVESGLTPEAALQLAAYRIAGAGNRDGRANGVEANGQRRLADDGKPDVAGILRSLKTRSAALRAKGDELGAAMADVESELYRDMPDNILNNGR